MAHVVPRLIVHKVLFLGIAALVSGDGDLAIHGVQKGSDLRPVSCCRTVETPKQSFLQVLVYSPIDKKKEPTKNGLEEGVGMLKVLYRLLWLCPLKHLGRRVEFVG